MQGSNLWCGGSPTKKKHKSRLLNPRKPETQKRSWEIDWILDFGSGTTKNGQSLSRQCSHAPVRVKSVSHRSNLAWTRKLQRCLHGVLSVTFSRKMSTCAFWFFTALKKIVWQTHPEGLLFRRCCISLHRNMQKKDMFLQDCFERDTT